MSNLDRDAQKIKVDGGRTLRDVERDLAANLRDRETGGSTSGLMDRFFALVSERAKLMAPAPSPAAERLLGQVRRATGVRRGPVSVTISRGRGLQVTTPRRTVHRESGRRPNRAARRVARVARAIAAHADDGGPPSSDPPPGDPWSRLFDDAQLLLDLEATDPYGPEAEGLRRSIRARVANTWRDRGAP